MTALEIFKKHGAHYYDDDEEAIIDAMNEYAQQQIDNYNKSTNSDDVITLQCQCRINKICNCGENECVIINPPSTTFF